MYQYHFCVHRMKERQVIFRLFLRQTLVMSAVRLWCISKEAAQRSPDQRPRKESKSRLLPLRECRRSLPPQGIMCYILLEGQQPDTHLVFLFLSNDPPHRVRERPVSTHNAQHFRVQEYIYTCRTTSWVISVILSACQGHSAKPPFYHTGTAVGD